MECSSWSPEIFRPHPDYKEYLISNCGKVWSNKTKKFLSVYQRSNGYQTTVFCKKGKVYCKYIHRLVLETFVGPCPEGCEACHNNGNPLDNALVNLRWDSKKANHLDSIKHGTAACLRKGEQHSASKLTNQEARQIIYMSKTNLFSQKDIAMLYELSPVTISNLLNKQTWKHLWKETA